MHSHKISVRDFVCQLGYDSGQLAIHAVCYYAEFVENSANTSTPEVQQLLDDAKVPEPKNLTRDLKALVEKKFLNVVRGTTATEVRYTVTNPGADVISAKMKEVGLIITKPTERTEILKEVSESLHTLILTIPDPKERDFIEEAISCLSPINNALRAAVVLAWSGTVHCLRRKIDQRGSAGYNDFTNHLRTMNPKAKTLGHINDFEDVKDVDLLEVCDKMNVIAGKSVKKQLQPWLDFRNGVGHPTNVKPGINKVKAFFEDIIMYVLSVP